MKNYLKTYAKKSVSLLLAVLMVMSCWVWMAPEEAKKAEAAPITYETKYTLTVSYTISNANYTSGHIQYKTSADDGWGLEDNNQTHIDWVPSIGSGKDDKGKGTGEKGDHVITKTDLTNFPTAVLIKGSANDGDCDNKADLRITEIKINNKVVWSGSFGFEDNNEAEIWCGKNADGSGDDNGEGVTGNYTWQPPMIVGFNDNTASASPINFSLAEVGKSATTLKTNFNFNNYDLYTQYGFKASNYLKTNNKYATLKSDTTWVSTTPTGSALSDGTEAYIYPAADSGNLGVTVDPAVQAAVSPTVDSNGNGSRTYYLIREYVYTDGFGGNHSSKVAAPITINYYKYSVNFNAGMNAEIKDAAGNYLGTGSYEAKGFHGTNITLPSDSKTTAAGKTFYGYWSEPQPNAGYGNYNAMEADFAKPCSTTDYNNYKALAGSTEENGVVTTAEGERWCNAGISLAEAKPNKIDLSGLLTPETTEDDFVPNWYGWWVAEDIDIKFYDVDGSFLGQMAVKSGQTQKDITWPQSKYKTYTSGAFKYTVDQNVWVNTDGRSINQNSYTFTEDLILTPKLTRGSDDFTGKYTVKFIDPNKGTAVTVGSQAGSYNYRQDIKSEAAEAQDKIDATPLDVKSDLNYSYELLGWSSVKPTTGKNYHVLLEDADFDVNGTSIGINNDWIVRNDETYYAVYRRHTKTYSVNFIYTDATGSTASRHLKVKYGDTLVPPSEYVPYTYVTGGFGYTFAGWSYKKAGGAVAVLGYNDPIIFTSEYISIQDAALDDGEDVTPIVINATYGEPEATDYKVVFNYVDDDGASDFTDAYVKHGEYILADTVAKLDPAAEWDHDEALYTYADKWKITEGAAKTEAGVDKKVGDMIDTADLTDITPISNLTFEAVYGEPRPFYTVTYVDGANTFSARVLQGSAVPAWTYKANNDNGTPDDATDDFKEDKIYVPADYEGEGGTYVFQGWYDQKQINIDSVNGNKITTADSVNKHLTLYSQFKFVPYTYTIRFIGYDGTQITGATREKGQSIEDITSVANKAAQTRPSDETYDYIFIGWDKAVPSFCEGHDATYTAQYKPVYRYYDVKWYNSRLVDGKWVADKSTSEVDGKTVETYLLATTHHTYNSKLYTPAVDNLTCLETAPEGQNYVFAGWYYNDAEGNAVKYERGMKITAEMEFYATYTLSAKTHTVTTVVRGETETYTVADGDAAVIPDPQAGWKDETTHDAFDGWYTDADCTTAFDFETAITEDVTLYAKFTESPHVYSEASVESVPTYYAKGEMKKWCACDQEKTTKTEEIPMLTDTKLPTGTIYLGGLGQWSSTDAIGGAALDTNDDGTDKEITIYANADTDVIITANDTGDVDPVYNSSGIGMGVKFIRAFVYPGKYKTLTPEGYGAAQQLTIDVYSDKTQELTNNANFAIKLGDAKVAVLDDEGKPVLDANGQVQSVNLQSGESYIVYYYVVDKAGNQLRTKVRTAKFIYDDTAPVFTVEGISNEAAVPTYCGKATVTGLEKDVVLTVNGEVVTATYAEGAETGTYVINYAEGMDNVFITATDKAGNTFSKKIKVNDHNWLVDEKASTCTEDGYKKEVCLICKAEKDEITYEAPGHVMGTPGIIPATCTENGYEIVKCDNCEYEVKNIFVLDEQGNATAEYLYPALGHDYAKDAEGNIIYTTVTASTCKTAGLAEAYCTRCGEGRITKELALDAENHEDITETTVEADCVNNGYYTKACSCDVILVHKDHTTDPDIYAAKGHGNEADGTAEWVVTLEPTCYQKGSQELRCKVCSNAIEDADGNVITEDIDATGEHVKTVTNPETYKTDGVVKYHCATEGCPYEYEDKILENEEVATYTVKFYAEDGTTLLAEFTQLEGTAIAKDAVTAPEKANSADGKYKYTFAGWSDGEKAYKLPLTVTENLVLKASYKEAKIMYKHIFKVQTTWTATLATDTNEYETYATLVGAMDDERVPSGTPVFKHKDATTDAALKKLYTFEFKGWKNAKGVIVTDFTVAGDAEFTAYFEAVPVTYDVIFYNGNDVIWTDNVNGGDTAVYENYVLGEDGKPAVDTEGNKTLILPEKDYDETNHYTFSNKWYTDAECTKEYIDAAITEKTRLYAGFTAIAHTLTVDTTKGSVVDETAPEVKDGIVQKATCELPEITAYVCSCGYTCEVQTANALGHDEYKVDENGEHVLVDGNKVINGGNETINGVVYYVVRCSRCNEILRQDKVSVTVKFENADGSRLDRVSYAIGDTIAMPAITPAKADDDEFTYTFTGWSYKDGEATKFIAKDAENLGVAAADITFVATYSSKTKLYSVTYVDYSNNTLYYQMVEYGSTVPAYAGTTAPDTLTGPKYAENGHYVFDKWDTAAGTVVKSKVIVRPEFKLVAHTLVPTYSEPTCTKMGGTVEKCTCGYTISHNATVPALGHDMKQVDYVAPDYTTQTPGKIVYECSRCGESSTKEIPGTSYSIKATVKDENGNPKANARVELLKKNDGGVYETYMVKNTGADGVVIFAPLEKGEYRVYVTDTNTHYDATVKEDGSVSGGDITAQPENKPVDDSCKCSCHKDNFWGIIYRLIQKIIKFFAGKPSCCANPDSRI